MSRPGRIHLSKKCTVELAIDEHTGVANVVVIKERKKYPSFFSFGATSFRDLKKYLGDVEQYLDCEVSRVIKLQGNAMVRTLPWRVEMRWGLGRFDKAGLLVSSIDLSRTEFDAMKANYGVILGYLDDLERGGADGEYRWFYRDNDDDDDSPALVIDLSSKKRTREEEDPAAQPKKNKRLHLILSEIIE